LGSYKELLDDAGVKVDDDIGMEEEP